MKFSKFVFKAIDRLFYIPENPSLERNRLSGVTYVKDIAYSEEYPDMKLDICYVPRTDGSRYPVIFEIHGGGFSAGDKSYREVLCKYYAKHTGALVVNVNYGLGPDCVCPVPTRHLVAAINWVAANRRKYKMDLSHFVVTGDSAGGYYSAILAVLQGSEYLQKLYDCKPKVKFTAAILNCGIYDVPTALSQKVLFNLTDEVCQDVTGVTPDMLSRYAYRDGISPIMHITKKFPKTLLIFAKQDAFCKGQGESMLEKLTQCKVPHTYVASENLLDNHTYSLMWFSRKARETNNVIVKFLNEHFAEDTHYHRHAKAESCALPQAAPPKSE